jgi:hypothetical protein
LSAIIFSDTFKNGTYPGAVLFCACCVLFVFYFIIFLISHHHLLRLFHSPPFLILHCRVDTFHFDITTKNIFNSPSPLSPFHFLLFTPLISAFSRVLLLFFCNGLLVVSAAAAESEKCWNSHFGVAKDSYIQTSHSYRTFFFFFFKLAGRGTGGRTETKGLEGGRSRGAIFGKQNEKKHCFILVAGLKTVVYSWLGKRTGVSCVGDTEMPHLGSYHFLFSCLSLSLCASLAFPPPLLLFFSLFQLRRGKRKKEEKFHVFTRSG